MITLNGISVAERMTKDEKTAALLGIVATMQQVQGLAERLAGLVLKLEADGTELPSMKRTAQILAEVALGWEAGGGV